MKDSDDMLSGIAIKQKGRIAELESLLRRCREALLLLHQSTGYKSKVAQEVLDSIDEAGICGESQEKT